MHVQQYSRKPFYCKKKNVYDFKHTVNNFNEYKYNIKPFVKFYYSFIKI